MGDGDAAFFDERDEFVVEVCDVRLESLWAEETKLEEKKNKKEIKGGYLLLDWLVCEVRKDKRTLSKTFSSSKPFVFKDISIWSLPSHM